MDASGWLIRIVGVILIVAGLHAGRELLVPFSLAALLALLLAPISAALERLRIGRTPAVLLTVFFAAAVIGGVGWLVTRQVADVARKLPDHRVNIQAKTAQMGPLGEPLLKGYSMLEAAGAQLSRPRTREGAPTPPFRASESPSDLISSGAMDLLGDFFLSIFNTLGTGFIVLLLVIFLLVYRDDVRDRLIQLFGATKVKVTTQAMDDAATSTSRYLLTQSIVNLAYGVIVGAGLLAIGLPSAFLWGILAALSRFVPYFGPWLGAAVPIFLSLAVFPGWTRSLVLAGSWLAVEAVIANAVEPLLYGRKTGVSPLAVLMAAVFWTWAWGGLGLLLSIPLTVSLVVLGKHFPPLRFLHTMLSEDVSLEPRIQLYQRLLARDHAAAEEVVESFGTDKPPGVLFDQLLLPALSLAQGDRVWGRLEEASSEFIRKSLLSIADDIADRPAAPTAPPPIVAAQGAPHLVLVVPTADASDELGARMLQRVLELRHVHAESLPVGVTVGEKTRLAAERNPDLVILVALHPSALIPIRYLHKKIRSVLPDTEILIALLQAPGEPRHWSLRLMSKNGPTVVTSVVSAETSVAQSLPTRLLGRAAAAAP